MARTRWTPAIALALILAVALSFGIVAVERPTPAHADPLPTVPVMGPNILNADQLTAWYNSKHRAYNVPGISVHDLAFLFLAEGGAEDVRGDLAFAQAMVETGYLGFVGSIVSPANWNFAGMGACDSCHSGTQFPSPQMGVRAQIQDLRNYADITSRASNMHNPLVPQWYGSPASVAAHNFDTFFRKGHAPTWNQMGNGNHATSPIYGSVVIQTYMNMLSFIGLPPGAAAGANPVGNLESVTRSPAGVHVQGWTVDPSKSNPTAVDIYANGVGIARTIANNSRPDVAAAFSAAGANHGFSATLPIHGGNVCVYAINIGAGTGNPLLGCRVVPGPNPVAFIDSINRQPDGLHLRGWSLDPDSASPTFLDVYADGIGVAHLTANGNRPDIAAAYPGYGAAHGYDAVLPGVGGNVCVYAINLSVGDNTSLGCRNFLPANPVGSLDSATRVPTGIRVTGWALDADTTAAATVDIYANGVGYARISAGQARNDVGRVYPAYGIFRGFDYTVPIAGGQVCAYGVNAGPGGNVLLGCRNA